MDISAIPVLKKLTHLPVFGDPSHGVGIRDLVPPMALAAVAAGADGLLMEMHPNPDKAMSDGAQSLYPPAAPGPRRAAPQASPGGWTNRRLTERTCHQSPSSQPKRSVVERSRYFASAATSVTGVSGSNHLVKLILLPGLDGTSDLFADFFKELPGNVQARALCYPTDAYMNGEQLFRMVDSGAETDAPFLLVAESFSTPVAIRYAARSRQNVLGLVLVAGFTKSPLSGWKRSVARLFAGALFRLPLIGHNRARRACRSGCFTNAGRCSAGNSRPSAAQGSGRSPAPCAER